MKKDFIALLSAKDIDREGTRLFEVATSKAMFEKLEKRHEIHFYQINYNQMIDFSERDFSEFYEAERVLHQDALETLIDYKKTFVEKNFNEDIILIEGIIEPKEYVNFVKFYFLGTIGELISVQLLGEKGYKVNVFETNAILTKAFENYEGSDK